MPSNFIDFIKLDFLIILVLKFIFISTFTNIYIFRFNLSDSDKDDYRLNPSNSRDGNILNSLDNKSNGMYPPKSPPSLYLYYKFL